MSAIRAVKSADSDRAITRTGVAWAGMQLILRVGANLIFTVQARADRQMG